MTNINVLIADDHDLIRQGIRRIIEMEEDISVIGEASNGDDLVAMIRDYKPDVVVTDMHMPPYDNVKLIEIIKDKYPEVKIIVVSMEDDPMFVQRAIELGVNGYLLKESAGTEIVEAIMFVDKGEGYIDKALVSVLMSRLKSKTKEVSVFDQLTVREKDILFQMTKGLSNKEIGEVLFLSEKTIKNYSTKIFKKLEVKDRVHAILLSVEAKFDDYMDQE